MNDRILIVVTTPDSATADSISLRLVERSLAACAQISGPITSIYQWEGEIHKDAEWRLMLKTTKSNYKMIEEIIIEMHPFDVPQVISLPIIDGYGPYLDWLDQSVQ